jgi:hypothetical protein
VVTPVKTGVQEFHKATNKLDSGFRRNDGKELYADLTSPSRIELLLQVLGWFFNENKREVSIKS